MFSNRNCIALRGMAWHGMALHCIACIVGKLGCHRLASSQKPPLAQAGSCRSQLDATDLVNAGVPTNPVLEVRFVGREADFPLSKSINLFAWDFVSKSYEIILNVSWLLWSSSWSFRWQKLGKMENHPMMSFENTRRPSFWFVKCLPPTWHGSWCKRFVSAQNLVWFASRDQSGTLKSVVRAVGVWKTARVADEFAN